MTITIYCKPKQDAKGDWGYIVSSNDRLVPEYFEPVKYGAGLIAHDIIAHVHHEPHIDPILDEFTAIGVDMFYVDDSLEYPCIKLWQYWLDKQEIPALKYKHHPSAELIELVDRIIEYKLTRLSLLPLQENQKEFLIRNRGLLLDTTAKALTKGYRIAKDAYRYPSHAHKFFSEIIDTVLAATKSSYPEWINVTENSPVVIFRIKPHLGHIECLVENSKQ